MAGIDVWRQITVAGLTDEEGCRAWAAEMARSEPGLEDKPGLEVLHKLVELGMVTKYQAKVLTGQTRGPLRLGEWVVLQPVHDPVYRGWLEVVSAEDRQLGGLSIDPKKRRFFRSLSRTSLESLRNAAPSLEFARRQARIRAECLQSVFAPEVADHRVLLFVAPPSGKTLWQAFREQRPDRSTVDLIMHQVVLALAALHREGIVHGCPRPDRVYWDGRQATLIRDPLCRFAVSEESRESGILRPELADVEAAVYLAPEFVAPSPRPTACSDVYSIGVLWWWLLTGRTPARGRTVQQVLQAAAKPVPELPDDVRRTGEYEQLLRYALAKRPDRRFASAVELSSAMELLDEKSAPSESAAPRAESLPKPKPAQKSFSPTEATQKAMAATRQDRSLGRGTLGDRTKPVITRRRRQSNKWLLPVVGICSLLIILMLGLHFSGVLRPFLEEGQAAKRPGASALPLETVEQPVEPDPLKEQYVIVDSTASAPWAPPRLPEPLEFDLLPPGGQCFVAIRLARAWRSGWFDKLGSDWGPSLRGLFLQVTKTAGVPPEQIERLTFAFYAAAQEGAYPSAVCRVALREPESAASLLAAWGQPEPEEIADQKLYSRGETAYFFQQQEDGDPVTRFSFGPVELMREVAEFAGAEGPLLSALETLRESSDGQADVVLLVATPYLFTEGRGLLAALPQRLAESLSATFKPESRAALLQSYLQPAWYVEARLVASSEPQTGRLLARLQKNLTELPDRIEAWLVEETPHQYWRGLAIRYPQMLRTLVKYTRFGIEDGVALINLYLPSEASSNLLLTTWIALQETAIAADQPSAIRPGAIRPGAIRPGAIQPAEQSWTIEDYLQHPIRVSFAQEPIENALQLVAEEANTDLPSGVIPVRYVLDGSAFEMAGITRNQQLRDFELENKPVREALTEICRRGNPVTTVTDTRDNDQQLIWVVLEDPQSPGKTLISLTTRDAATAAGIEMPIEFAPDPSLQRAE